MYNIQIAEQIYSCTTEKDLLKGARSQMVKVPYGCANGGCGVCKVKVTKGQYEMKAYSNRALTDEERNEGNVLLCKTYPLSDIQAEFIK